MAEPTGVCEVCGQPAPPFAVMCPLCGAGFTRSAQVLPVGLADDADRPAEAPGLAPAGGEPAGDCLPRPPATPFGSSLTSENAPGPESVRVCRQCGLGDLTPDVADCPSCGFALGGVLDQPGEALDAAELTVEGRRVALADGQTLVLGRDPAASSVAEVLAGRAGVSRRHAAVRARGRTMTVWDLGSTNGTWLDGRRLGDQPAELAVPVRFRLGQAVEVEIRRVGRRRAEPDGTAGGPADAAGAGGGDGGGDQADRGNRR